MRENSIIKRKILQYLDFKSISNYQFYKITGITNGILSQNNGISEDNLMRFLNYFPDISLDWLFYNRGEMLRSVGHTSPTVQTPRQAATTEPSALIAALRETIAAKDALIASQTELIAELKRRCAILEGKPPNSAALHDNLVE